MPSHLDAGAVVFADIDSHALKKAFAAVVSTLGYVADEPADFEVVAYGGAGGACLAFRCDEGWARVVARRLAAHVERSLRVFTARLEEHADDTFACVLGDVRVAADGTVENGDAWPDDLTARCHGDWTNVSDGKSYFAVAACLEDAVATALPDASARGSVSFRSPPSLGSPRLDDLATKARLADRALLTLVGGRECLRLVSAGATVTSFVAPEEASALREAVPALRRP